ncbi:MAG: Fe-S cluster assembly protein SufD [Chloroflexi bacterium 13_1_40CM_3_65_12]|nr:MAG: Fe-S cluster assembly protein SufD [Chloroflexi bacterium 13_1_40CM_65_17]OLC67420.1 MAG: Fe-S cluster assembly protein SufD [Actinobacteria bacterium 13_1_40CM_4_65_12]OLD23430.1 MAG: Fe-S cluster assembly protein SufD [Chloroflexi bacterium 13_1_40CM_3_65_12]
MPFTLETMEEIASLHGEPAWLRKRRRSSFDAFERLPAPSRIDEEWRRTDVSGFDPGQYSKLEHLDGQKLVLPSTLPPGVILKPLRQAAQDHPDLVEPRLFSLVHADRDRFTALHAAFFTGGTFLYVPDGVVIEQPVIGQHFSHEGGTSVLPHTLIVAGKGARFNYLDEYIAEDGNEIGYRSGSTEIFAGEGSQVGYVAVQKWGRNAWHFADQRAELQKDASLRLFNVTLGARFSKTRVEATLQGQGADAELKAIYFASGEQFFDFHTLQDHQVGNTRSDLLFKGALQDVARTVYAGLIRIEKGAARSDAYQANRNLVLSDHAKATSIPMLEIDNNDVRCTHGATVGPVDPLSMFYLRSRGIPEATAKRMIVQGFFGDVLDRIPFEHARALVEAELEARLG